MLTSKGISKRMVLKLIGEFCFTVVMEYPFDLFQCVTDHEIQSLEDLQYLQESVYEEMGLTVVERSKLNYIISTSQTSNVSKEQSKKQSGTE